MFTKIYIDNIIYIFSEQGIVSIFGSKMISDKNEIHYSVIYDGFYFCLITIVYFCLNASKFTM